MAVVKGAMPAILLAAACQFGLEQAVAGDAAGDGSGGSAATATNGAGSGSSAVITSGPEDGTAGVDEASTAATTSGDQGPPAEETFRKRLSIGPPKEALVDFTAAIVLDGDPDLAAHARPDGADIFFTSDDGVSTLAFERERYDGRGSLVAWVRIPALPAGRPTDIFVRYGDPDAEDAQDPATAWSDAYVGVWHLGDPEGAAPQYPDSGHAGYHGEAVGDVVPAPGIAGIGAGFDGSAAQITIGAPRGDLLSFGLSSFTFSLWLFTPSSLGSYDMPWHKGGDTASNEGYDMELGQGDWLVWTSDGSMTAIGYLGTEADFLGQWVHLAGVIDREAGVLTVYANGAETDSVDITGMGSMSATATPARIGHTSYPVDGIVDEVRVEGAARSAAWMAAVHANLADPSFVQVGPEETLP